MILKNIPTRTDFAIPVPGILLESVLNSHWLPEIAQKINEKLAAEAAAREKFFEEVTESQKAEFIDGVVFVHSPAKLGHIEATGRLLRLLGAWTDKHGGIALAEKALCVFERNSYEPDIVYFSPEKANQLDKHTMKSPVPDFIIEVLSESTEINDRGVKFEDYAAHGVKEYWIVDAMEETLEQYLLGPDGSYKLKMKMANGDVVSEVLTGLVLPIRGIFEAEAFRAAMERIRKAAL